MMPISNPDNTTQELPLSLAVTDERSNCRSITTSQEQWRHTNTTTWPTPRRPMPNTFMDSGPSSLK
ncbi:hypothetical protein Taro_006375 [Colocasia esculenta]|uniref:Uncharacterized protein n=1 Tax=Colocasia esculenta TaxID=4460 RepID=A0A843TV42_COLES|nr:hypothetical protein [Colocasia esculenta]